MLENPQPENPLKDALFDTFRLTPSDSIEKYIDSSLNEIKRRANMIKE